MVGPLLRLVNITPRIALLYFLLPKMNEKTITKLGIRKTFWQVYLTMFVMGADQWDPFLMPNLIS